ncbi:Co2+/Mg2+ efflux protein ApaG [Pseudoteredinibacter isoporae]|uniref:Protein ApaG n=1 Tax=Pseudoteredinibacter isoporae TaxID=570281 RepID=A0A7X0JTR0_9GAMM|nr:Co2+/Mg2+ efflux protein ApaG [Pseudoteredinibacter isoporae]MBB6521166.1 ApaG protein [Pseudoteredinibacter isoporae]NHO86726.1 Co2+/Mg2+ efflux protein ApaG [Pseudoteredinibacter isoporae]NIB24822.1 Co2+/Mg2+ efflux protein ApaG [Pseudoteredinibacter isoporae]
MTDIDIQTKPQYIEEQSKPEEPRYVYAYTIRITNNGQQAAQLISRHWKIVDENEQLQEVRGLGVVGEQPRLEPGESFSYSSGVIIETPTGTMEGSYTMKRDDGSQFEAAIDTFALIPPNALH